MSNINNIIYNNTNYPIGQTEDIELPIDYNTVYDTEEHQIGWYAVTGGYKPVYRKVIECNNVNLNNLTFSTGLTNVDYKYYYGYHLSSSSAYSHFAVGHYRNASDYACGMYITNNNITFELGGSHPAGNIYVVLEYTKTTDTVVAEIPKQTIPVIAQKQDDIYSLDEQVIGQWIDGKPLYRKTFDCGALPNNGYKQMAIGDLNIDFITDIHGITHNPTDGAVCPLPNVGANDVTKDVLLNYNVISKNIVIKTGLDRSGYTKTYVTIEYTKTTDTVGGAE